MGDGGISLEHEGVERETMLKDFQDILKASPEFTQKALQILVEGGTNLRLPKDGAHIQPDGSLLVPTTTLEQAATEHVLGGRAPQTHIRTRLGVDASGKVKLLVIREPHFLQLGVPAVVQGHVDFFILLHS